MGDQSARIEHTDLPWGDPQLAPITLPVLCPRFGRVR
eukprot:gene26835-biopygen17424